MVKNAMNISTIPVCVLAIISMASCKPQSRPTAQASPTASPAVSAAAGVKRPERGQRDGNRGDMAQRAKERFEQMKTDLALTDDQAQKISAIMDQQRTAMEAVRADQSMDREQRTAKITEMRQAFANQIDPLLTPEQKTKWEELRKKREAEMGERRSKRSEQGRGGQPQQQ